VANLLDRSDGEVNVPFPRQHRQCAHFPALFRWAARVGGCPCPVRRQTYGYLPSLRWYSLRLIHKGMAGLSWRRWLLTVPIDGGRPSQR